MLDKHNSTVVRSLIRNRTRKTFSDFCTLIRTYCIDISRDLVHLESIYSIWKRLSHFLLLAGFAWICFTFSWAYIYAGRKKPFNGTLNFFDFWNISGHVNYWFLGLMTELSEVLVYFFSRVVQRRETFQTISSDKIEGAIRFSNFPTRSSQ